MIEVNKKLWSFNFGCLIAASFVWLVSFGLSAPVHEAFYPYPTFVFDIYPNAVTALLAIAFTVFMIIAMRKLCQLCVSDHTFWLILPSLMFIILTMIAGQKMLSAVMFAALPAILVITSLSYFKRLSKYKKAS